MGNLDIHKLVQTRELICQAINNHFQVRFILDEVEIIMEPYILFREDEIDWVQGFNSAVDFRITQALRTIDISRISGLVLLPLRFIVHATFHPVIESTTQVYCRIR